MKFLQYYYSKVVEEKVEVMEEEKVEENRVEVVEQEIKDLLHLIAGQTTPTLIRPDACCGRSSRSMATKSLGLT